MATLRLIAEPFATLTPEQREAVETWAPPGMEIAQTGPGDEWAGDEDDPFGPDDAPFGDPEEVDPDETFDVEDEPAPQEAPETAPETAVA